MPLSGSWEKMFVVFFHFECKSTSCFLLLLNISKAAYHWFHPTEYTHFGVHRYVLCHSLRTWYFVCVCVCVCLDLFAPLTKVLFFFQTKKAMEVGRLGRIAVEDIIFLIRKDPKKYSRVKELLLMSEELRKARKAFDEIKYATTK